MTDAQTIIREAYNKLPLEVREVLQKSDLVTPIRNIALKNMLRADDALLFENEVTYVLLGAEHPDSFRENLRRELPHIPETLINNLITETNTSIFSPIREALIDFQKNKSSIAVTQKPSVVEDPPLETQASNLVALKMGTAVRVPQQTQQVQLNHVYRHGDPYREPIE